MGLYLSEPVRDKTCSSYRDDCGVQAAACTQQGWRTSQEDAHLHVRMDQHTQLFAVFDGHGGPEIALYLASNLPRVLRAAPSYDSHPRAALREAFLALDEELTSANGAENIARAEALRKAARQQCAVARALDAERAKARAGLLRYAAARGADVAALSAAMEAEECAPPGGPYVGSTCLVALLREGMVYVANAGDSRCVVCRVGGVAHALSRDHTPALPCERRRIRAAGSCVVDGRVEGTLALSRALGDAHFKQARHLTPQQQAVTARPELRCTRLQASDEFLILACDGVWECTSSQAAVTFVRTRLARGDAPQAVAAALCDACTAEDPGATDGLGCDNTTVMIVLLTGAGAQGANLGGGCALSRRRARPVVTSQEEGGADGEMHAVTRRRASQAGGP